MRAVTTNMLTLRVSTEIKRTKTLLEFSMGEICCALGEGEKEIQPLKTKVRPFHTPHATSSVSREWIRIMCKIDLLLLA